MFKFLLGLVITIVRSETYFKTDYINYSADCSQYPKKAGLGALDQEERAKCMRATFKQNCKYDASGRTVKPDVVKECLYSNWSGDCKFKDIWISKGDVSWELTDGTAVDPSQN